jgi:hypothetical protein
MTRMVNQRAIFIIGRAGLAETPSMRAIVNLQSPDRYDDVSLDSRTVPFR